MYGYNVPSDTLSFFECVIFQNHVAIDFYDGSIMYDFANGKTTIRNIDEITNVYILGATAFALFGEYDRTREKWKLSDRLFEIATKAVSDDRSNRHYKFSKTPQGTLPYVKCPFSSVPLSSRFSYPPRQINAPFSRKLRYNPAGGSLRRNHAFLPLSDQRPVRSLRQNVP